MDWPKCLGLIGVLKLSLNYPVLISFSFMLMAQGMTNAQSCSSLRTMLIFSRERSAAETCFGLYVNDFSHQRPDLFNLAYLHGSKCPHSCTIMIQVQSLRRLAGQVCMLGSSLGVCTCIPPDSCWTNRPSRRSCLYSPEGHQSAWANPGTGASWVSAQASSR